MIVLFRKHYYSLLLALIIGLAMVAPQLIFIWRTGDLYQGIYMFHSDAELHNLARMEEAYDGNGVGNPFIHEYKDTFPPATYVLIEQVLAWPGIIFSLSIPTLNLIYKFLFPAIATLLAYGLSWRLTGRTSWSLASASLMIAGAGVLSIGDFANLVQWKEIYGQFATYARPINPQFSGIVLFLYLHSLLSLWYTRHWKYVWTSSVLFGASYYIYFYSFTFFLTLTVVLAAAALLIGARRMAYQLLLVIFISTVIGSYALLMLYKVQTHELYPTLAQTFNVLHSHRPTVSVFVLVTVFFFGLYGYIKNAWRNEVYVFLGSILVTGFVVINQQILTGTVLQEGHYHWYFNLPLSALVVTWLLSKTVTTKWVPVVVVFIVTLSFSYVTLVQVSSYKTRFTETLAKQDLAPALHWISTHADPGDVVLAGSDLSELIPVYTQADVVWDEHAAYYLLPDERRKYRPQEIMTAPDLKKELQKYKVDYIVWDTKSDPDWKLDRYANLVLVYHYDLFKIYTF